MKSHKKREVEDFEGVEHGGRKKKDKKEVISIGSEILVVDKDTMVDSSSGVIEGDEKGDVTMSDNEEREEESRDGVAGKDKKVRRKEKTTDRMEFDGEERKVEKRKKDNVLARDENEREGKKRKKDKGDHMMVCGDKETKVKKKKKIEEDNVVVAGIEGKKVRSHKKPMRDDMKAQNKERKRKRKRKDSEDVVAAGHEEQNKLKDKNKNKKEVMKVFLPSDSSKSLNDNEGGLVQGKRFSEEENELIKKAVSDYIGAKQLGKEGLNMVLHCRSHPHLKGCWQEICGALPWRTHNSVYQRAHKLYRQGGGTRTPEEVEQMRKSYKKYCPKWKRMADELGRFCTHVRHAFQRYQFGNLNKGKWSQHEYQTLFELVNKDLMMNVFVEKKSKYGLLMDNIRWEAISWKLGTRNVTTFCAKWYSQLTSPMVAEGKWADVDDYRLLMVLVDLDASCEDEVEWDSLLENRSGELCRKRWLHMMRHLGEHGNKSFSEQVEILSKRYCTDLAEVREAMDARPVVD